MTSENSNAINILVKKMIQIVDSRTEHLKYDKTFHTTVMGTDGNGLYTVNYLGQPYQIRNALNTDLSVGETVWVKIPGGIFRQMHICGIYRPKKDRKSRTH